MLVELYHLASEKQHFGLKTISHSH